MTPDLNFSPLMFSDAPLTIYPAGCKQQKEDINMLLHAIDDFGATTFALSSNSAQGYSMFIDARNQIREQFERTLNRYRLVKEVAS